MTAPLRIGNASAGRDARLLGDLPSGWRNVPSQPQRAAFEVGGERIGVGYRHTRGGLAVEGHDGQHLRDMVLVPASSDEVVL